MKHIFTKPSPLLFFIFTFSILFFMLGFVFVADAQEGLVRCGGEGKPSCGFNDLIELTQKVINFLIVIIGIPLATALFSYAGWLYMSAGGDSGKIAQGHKIFKSVIFGLVIALAAWLIVNTIANALLKKSEFKDFLYLKQTSIIEHNVIAKR